MMLAARELKRRQAAVSSRNWINEKLIYTHGYGVTMNPVNGFSRKACRPGVKQHADPDTIPGSRDDPAQIYFCELTIPMSTSTLIRRNSIIRRATQTA